MKTVLYSFNCLFTIHQTVLTRDNNGWISVAYNNENQLAPRFIIIRRRADNECQWIEWQNSWAGTRTTESTPNKPLIQR